MHTIATTLLCLAVAAAPAGEAPPADAGPFTEGTPPAQAALPAEDVPGANLRIRSITVDGVALSDVACHLEGGGVGGFLAGMMVGAGFKERRTQLDACSKQEVAHTRVAWLGQGGTMTRVKASGSSAAVNQCVERALTGAPSTVSGACAATVSHGKPEAAKAKKK